MGKVNSLSKIERAYIAGFLDGDGSVMALIERHTEKRFGIRSRVVVEFTQHSDNVKVLHFLRRKIGSGGIHKSLREVYKYSIKDQYVVRNLLEVLKDFVVIKKRQITLALRILSISIVGKRDLIRIASLSDMISRHNLRSKSRRINGSALVKELISRND